MSVETTEITIVNDALMQLGLPPISNLEDDSDAATRVARRVVSSRRRKFLTDTLWNFCTIQGEALLDPESTPLFDFDSYYLLPAGCLELVGVGSEENPIDESEWDYRGGKILFNGTAASIPVEYIKDETDYSLWPDYVVDAFVWDLAAKLARPLTKDLKRAADAEEQALRAFREAAARDLQARPARFRDDSIIQRAREWTRSGDGFKVSQSVLDDA